MSYPAEQHRPEDFETLRVYRRVEQGAEQFIAAARGFELRFFPPETTSNIPVEGESLYVPGVRPYCSFVAPEDLKLEVLTRRDPPETRPVQRYKVLKRKLAIGVTALPKSKERKRGAEPIVAVEPLGDSLDRIQYIVHEIDEGKVYVDIVGIGFQLSPDVKNGEYDLVLIPNIASEVGHMLLAQHSFVHGRVASLSRRVAHPGGPGTLAIPFCSVRDVPSEMVYKENNFHEQLRSRLPLRLKLGKVEIS